MVVQNPIDTKFPVLRLDAAVSKPEFDFDGALPCAVPIQETADGFVPSTCMNPGLFGFFPSSTARDHIFLLRTAPEAALLETIRTADGIALVVPISNRIAEMSRFPGHTDPGEVLATVS